MNWSKIVLKLVLHRVRDILDFII